MQCTCMHVMCIIHNIICMHVMFICMHVKCIQEYLCPGELLSKRILPGGFFSSRGGGGGIFKLYVLLVLLHTHECVCKHAKHIVEF